MGQRIWFNLLVISIQILVAAAITDSQEYGALQSLKASWENTPPNWVGPDPCGDGWDGIHCNNSHVISITLGSIGLKGQLSGEIQLFPELQFLDLSYNKELTGPIPSSIGNLKKLINLALMGCGFIGSIPVTIGSMQQLVILSLNSNRLIGQIPPSIGNLSNLSWLDLLDNSLTGTLPVSDVATQGLDMLVKTKHFHLQNNLLSGDIPSRLFSPNMTLIHVIFDGNQLTGDIPSSLADVQTLEVVRLDRNQLSGPIPSNLCNLIHLRELYIANNQLNGQLPNLTGMNSLLYMDVSNNTLNMPNIPPSMSTLQSLTTLMMENTGLRGEIPENLFSLPQLHTVVLKNNRLSGTLDIGSSYSNQLQLIDLRNNSIDSFTERPQYSMKLILLDNPYCNGGEATSKYCVPPQPDFSYATPPNSCMPTPCSPNQVSSPNCRCAYPYTGKIYFRALSFSQQGNSSIYMVLQRSLLSFFDTTQLPVDSVSLSNPTKNLAHYLVINLAVFPSGEDRFNRTAISGIVLVFSNLTFRPPPELFGPYFFIGDRYEHFAADAGSRKSSSSGVVIGAAIGGSVLGLLVLVAGVYAFRLKRIAERSVKQNNPFASWDANKGSGDVPQLKGARCFSFEELKKCTNNFSEANAIGTGGYGKVYRGSLPNGQLVAIKRAQQRSMQGGYEFKTEIELLSRVHHKNVVGLVGFCFEQGEQMLVYEYIPNGTLKDSLSGRSGFRLDWMRRLRIAIGAARGLQYLHDLADPPIIHRDVKSNNILLDEHLNAKVADFGLSKSLSDVEQGHVTTQVKGTMGYLDPEYYITQHLTEKSDVYSFGVLLLELVTGRNPIKKGKYIVREVKQAMDMTKDLYGLQSILDPVLSSSMTPKSVEKFVDLALRCVEEAVVNRPLMSEVVKEIEIIMELVGLDPDVKSISTSATYEGTSKDSDTPYTNESLFAYCGAYLP